MRHKAKKVHYFHITAVSGVLFLLHDSSMQFPMITFDSLMKDILCILTTDAIVRFNVVGRLREKLVPVFTQI